MRNASSLPVYDVRLEWLLDGVLWRHVTRATVPPTDEPVFVLLPTLSDYRRAERVGNLMWQEALKKQVHAPEGDLDVQITFRDTAGRTWRRSVDGALSEVRARGARRRWVTTASERPAVEKMPGIDRPY